MVYLTEIRNKDGHLLPFLFVKLYSVADIRYFLDCSFTFYDTATQKTFFIVDKPDNINVGTEIGIGFSIFTYDKYDYCAAAVYNENTAELCRFAKLIDSQPISTHFYDHDDSDICFEAHCDRNVISNRSTLTVELSEDTWISNWVVFRMPGATFSNHRSWNMAYTLYDFLLYLCRHCELNVMLYKTIRLVGTISIWTIELADSSDAKKFFDKMYERALIKRYVSDIRVDGKSEKYAVWPCSSNLVVTTKNIDSKVTEKVSNFPIDDCYGFSARQENGGDRIVPYRSFGVGSIVVSHTNKAIQLFKYIKFAKTYWKLPEHSSDADSCYWGKRANYNTPQDAATRTLKINSGRTIIRLYEPPSSIIYVNDNTGIDVKYLSLFDFLILCCRKTGLIIMLYGTVQIINDDGVCETEIRFDHGKEANRFFTKMYLDAIKG